MPGSSPTIARREPTRRLNSVDLPTLGRPTMARVGMPAAAEAADEFKVGWVIESCGDLCTERVGLRLVPAERSSAVPGYDDTNRRSLKMTMFTGHSIFG